MSVKVTQYLLSAPGRQPHWCGLLVTCPHGLVDGEVLMQIPPDGPPTAAALGIHRLLHVLLRAHRRRAGCACGTPILALCWASDFPIDIERFSRN